MRVIGFDEALRIAESAATPLGRESVPIDDAHGRVLARDLHAQVSAPPANVSAMDGYAVRETDLAALPARLRIVGQSFAGRPHGGSVGPGECVRIFTGAAVPDGADRVVVQEMVRREHEIAVIEERPGQAPHIRVRGSDFAEGDLLLPAGRLLDYRAMVALAGADMGAVELWRKPRVALLATGDELAVPGTARRASGRIPESVSYGVLALARDWGAKAVGRNMVADDLAAMERVAGEAVEAADLVVVTGGASVGEKDFARAMFAPFGPELLFAKVAIRPGKPVWLARVRDRLVLGLPGNPVSALVTARLFLAPLIAGMSGRGTREALQWRRVGLAAPLPPCGDRETFVRARWNGTAAEPVSNQDSSAQQALAQSNLLLRRRIGAPELSAGEMIDALDL